MWLQEGGGGHRTHSLPLPVYLLHKYAHANTHTPVAQPLVVLAAL